MISFNIGLTLPYQWAENAKKINLDFWRHGSFFNIPHKFWEVQIAHFNWTTLFDISIDTRWAYQDHGGVFFDLTVLGFYFGANVYDERHWNDDANRWYVEGEEESEWGERPDRKNILIEQSDAYRDAKKAYAERSEHLRRRPDDLVETMRRLLMEIETK
jgi:hypothetical protein